MSGLRDSLLLVETCHIQNSQYSSTMFGTASDTQQAMSPTMQSTHDAWAHEEVTKMLQPLHRPSPPLSNSSFKNAFTQLHANMVNQHATREAQELAQHANREAREDR